MWSRKLIQAETVHCKYGRIRSNQGEFAISYRQSTRWRKQRKIYRPAHHQTVILYWSKKYFNKDVSREFDEFQVNTHLCKLRCLFALVET